MDGLNAKDITNIRKAYIEAKELEEMVNRAKACEFDCEEVDQRCQRAKAQCERIIQTYGPFFPSPKA
jgi:hypothetical protein